MKRLFNCFLLFAMLSLNYERVLANEYIDLRTGMAGNTYGYGAGIPDYNQDDGWQVCLPGGSPSNPNAFIPTYIGCPWPFAPVSGAKWISPGTSVMGSNLISNGPVGEYYYKLSFYVSSCNITGATINFNTVGCDNRIFWMSLNASTNLHYTNYGFGPNALDPSDPGVSPTDPYNLYDIQQYPANVTLGAGEITQGWNFIWIAVTNYGGYSGMVIDGYIDIQSQSSLNFTLKDKAGVRKTEYCIGEDVFLNMPGAITNTYYLNISEVIWNGNGYNVNQLCQQGTNGIATGNPNNVNLTSLFATHPTTPVAFVPGKVYRIMLKIIYPNCTTQYVQDFTYKCCDISSDPSFWASVSNGQLITKSSLTSSSHTWVVYKIPLQNIGNYTKLGTYHTPSIAYNTEGGCFYVTHSITNSCGTSCVGQVVCSADCTEKGCNMGKPGNLLSGQTNNRLSWSQVVGATYYTVEINPYDPRCCPPADPDAPMIYTPSKYYNIYNDHAYIWNREEIFPSEGTGPVNPGPPCFSWRVIAHCPDGGQTISNYGCSWDDGSIPPPNDPTGLVGDKPGDNGNTNTDSKGKGN